MPTMCEIIMMGTKQVHCDVDQIVVTFILWFALSQLMEIDVGYIVLNSRMERMWGLYWMDNVVCCLKG